MLSAEANNPDLYKISALRFSFASVEHAFSRVKQFCFKQDTNPTNKPSLSEFSGVLADCWHVIDAASRARNLTQQLSFPSELRSARKDFQRELEELKNGRNILHHFDHQARSLAELAIPLSGALAWIDSTNPMQAKLLTLTNSGIRAEYPSLIFDREESRFVTDFVFRAASFEVCLLAIAQSCALFLRDIERVFAEAGSSMLIDLHPVVFVTEFRLPSS